MSEHPILIEIQSINFPNDLVDIDVFNITRLCPFEVKRVYTINSNSKPSIRGNHAHKNQSQLLHLITGQANVILTNKSGETFEFELGSKSLFIPKNHWIEISLSPNSVLLCFAEQLYEDLESTVDKPDFLNQ